MPATIPEITRSLDPAGPPRPDQAPPKNRTTKAAGGEDARSLRLIIAVPAVLILLTLGYGLISYISFSNRWDALVEAGVGELVGGLWRVHLGAMLGLAVAAALMGLLLTHTILRPIRMLSETTRMVASGQLDVQTPAVNAAPEFEELAHNFNLMIDEVQRSITQRNRCLVDNIPIGVLIVDLDGRVSAVNPAGAEILGLSPESIVGRTVAALEGTLPDATRPLARLCAGVMEGSPESITAEVQLDGDEPEGRALKVSISPLHDDERRSDGMMFSFRETAGADDLTRHLSRTDQLAALGTFALGLAHQLRNPLGAVKGLSQLLLLERGLAEQSRDYLDRMVHEVDRVDTFVRKLLEMASPPPEKPSAEDLGQILQDARHLARQELPRECFEAVDYVFEADASPCLMVEVPRLIQAFANLLLNAYQNTPHGGRITVSLGQTQLDGHPLDTVTITNTATTIAPDMRNRVFEPFFTTRERAAGLGLTVAAQIIAQNGGMVDLEVEPDAVTFKVRFDSSRRVEAESPHAQHPETRREGGDE